MGGETVGQIAQRNGRYPIPGNIQGKVGWGSEQHPLVEYVPAYHKGLGLDDPWKCFTTQRFLRSYDFIYHKDCEKELSTEIRAFKTSLNPGIQFFVPVQSLEEQHFLTFVCAVRLSMLEFQASLSCGICDLFGLLLRSGDRAIITQNNLNLI